MGIEIGKITAKKSKDLGDNRKNPVKKRRLA
jgi:hypothetical protein